MKYVLMFIETEKFAQDFEAMTPQEKAESLGRVTNWLTEHASKLRGGSRLQHPDTATTVRLDGSEPFVTDGPFVEGKEVISGFQEIEVEDLDEALRMVRTWPGCPIVEIRPAMF
ncbi:YciI family protein [Tenggerimyces flavus]|uniref:YciI family protein n=1 Tax=Tenggerimyces flavus TaxID=1708749 RepID=A0ABV7YEQ8_9ACTN|nr:YciI family protein [Tenggerimyces flavus]MBM7786727.1 hypothetical protein [Tenggerimyces flavus]